MLFLCACVVVLEYVLALTMFGFIIIKHNIIIPATTCNFFLFIFSPFLRP